VSTLLLPTILGIPNLVPSCWAWAILFIAGFSAYYGIERQAYEQDVFRRKLVADVRRSLLLERGEIEAERGEIETERGEIETERREIAKIDGSEFPRPINLANNGSLRDDVQRSPDPRYANWLLDGVL
jgi:hypothetical protein